jgi:hypothetical protein
MILLSYVVNGIIIHVKKAYKQVYFQIIVYDINIFLYFCT